MLVETFPVGALACNCSIVADPESRKAVLIDPGGDPDRIRARIERGGFSIERILITHGHIDHVGAAAELQKAAPVDAHIHAADRFVLDMLPIQAVFIGQMPPARPQLGRDLVDEEVLKVGALDIRVIHTPGHSPGSVSLLISSGDERLLFSGDTLFQGGVGRTDLWGGDSKAITRSIRSRLYTLDDDLLVVPGHGDRTTIGEEKDSNPFVRESSL